MESSKIERLAAAAGLPADELMRVGLAADEAARIVGLSGRRLAELEEAGEVEAARSDRAKHRRYLLGSVLALAARRRGVMPAPEAK